MRRNKELAQLCPYPETFDMSPDLTQGIKPLTHNPLVFVTVTILCTAETRQRYMLRYNHLRLEM